MDAFQPHYRMYGYHGERVLFDFTRYVDQPCDDSMIEDLARRLSPDDGLESGLHGDLFYCDAAQISLVGTWVIEPDGQGGAEPMWHANGWIDRPKPSKEKSLRFLHGLKRPA